MPKKFELDPITDVIIERHAREYFSPLRPSLASVYMDLEVSLQMENLRRQKTGEALLSKPPLAVLRARVNAIRAQVPATAAAHRGDTAPDGGLRSTYARAGQHVRIEHLRFDAGPAFPGVRLDLCVVFECVTGYILGVKLSADHNAASSIGTALLMAMTDKTRIARDAGAVLPWIGMCRPETISVEAGLISPGSRLQQMLAELEIELLVPPAGESVRGPSEGLARGLVDFLATPPESPSLSDLVDQAERHLIRAVCDDYLHVLHPTAGRSPHHVFTEAAAKGRMRPIPKPDILTLVLGVEHRAKVGASGIEFAGMLYTSSNLEEFFRDQKGAVTFRYNPYDMRELCVSKGDFWYAARSVVELPPDVSASELMAVHAKLGRAWPEFNVDAVYEALGELRAAS